MQFRNFLRRPAPRETFGYALGHGGPARTEGIRHLMSGLSKRMSLEYEWPHSENADIERWENPNIPTGYAYLAQFVAHDCVFSSTPTGALSEIGAGLRSRRSKLLQLETIYGDGPDASPNAYVARGNNLASRNLLLVGRASPPQAVPGICPYRDLARARASNFDHKDVAGLTSALISDPRNDVHAAMAQFTTLFHQLHNNIAEVCGGHRARGRQPGCGYT